MSHPIRRTVSSDQFFQTIKSGLEEQPQQDTHTTKYFRQWVYQNSLRIPRGASDQFVQTIKSGLEEQPQQGKRISNYFRQWVYQNSLRVPLVVSQTVSVEPRAPQMCDAQVLNLSRTPSPVDYRTSPSSCEENEDLNDPRFFVVPKKLPVLPSVSETSAEGMESDFMATPIFGEQTAAFLLTQLTYYLKDLHHDLPIVLRSLEQMQEGTTKRIVYSKDPGRQADIAWTLCQQWSGCSVQRQIEECAVLEDIDYTCLTDPEVIASVKKVQTTIEEIVKTERSIARLKNNTLSSFERY